jgi:hypothetical protein
VHTGAARRAESACRRYRREELVGRFVDDIQPVAASPRLASHYGAALERWAPVRVEDSLDTPFGVRELAQAVHDLLAC